MDDHKEISTLEAIEILSSARPVNPRCLEDDQIVEAYDMAIDALERSQVAEKVFRFRGISVGQAIKYLSEYDPSWEVRVWMKEGSYENVTPVYFITGNARRKDCVLILGIDHLAQGKKNTIPEPVDFSGDEYKDRIGEIFGEMVQP